MPILRRFVLPGLLALAAAMPAAAQPAAPAAGQPGPLTFDGLSTTLTNMGYEPKLDPNGKSLTIVVHAAYDLTVTYSLGSGGGELLAYIYLQKLSAEQQAQLNMTALLLANDAGPGYFSLARSQADFLLYVQRSLPAAAVTPVTLRATLENLVKLTTANETTWNTRLWK